MRFCQAKITGSKIKKKNATGEGQAKGQEKKPDFHNVAFVDL
jgi:hypothetical protein